MTDKFKSVPVLSSEITPKSQYLSRRDFLKAAGIVTGTALLAACAPKASEQVDGGAASRRGRKAKRRSIRQHPATWTNLAMT